MRFLFDGVLKLQARQICILVLARVITQAALAQPTSPEEIEIVGDRLSVQTLSDRKVYHVSESLQAVTGSAADLLVTIPSVEVDADGLVMLRGDSKVTILLDGKPSAQFTGSNAGLALQQLNGADIESIEVMTTPPPQYRADGSAGVINIVTKKTRAPGWSGTAQLSGASRERAVSAGTLAYNRAGLTVTGGVSFREDFRQRQIDEMRSTLDPGSDQAVLSHEKLTENLRRETPAIKAGLDYRLNDRQSLDLSVNHRELTGTRRFGEYDVSGPSASPVDSVTQRNSDGHEWNMSGSQSARFEQKFARPEQTLTVSYQRSVTRERERYVYSNLNVLPQSPESYDDLHLGHDLVKNELGGDVVLPVGDGQTMKTGIDITQDDNDFDNSGDILAPVTFMAISNPLITDRFHYHQQVDSAYASYQSQEDPWSFLIGLRVEQTAQSSLQEIGAIAHHQRFFHVLPSLKLNDDLTERDRLFAAIARRINRPDAEDLNPLTDSQDIHNLRAGNAMLLPQDTWSFETGYGFDAKNFRYDLTGYYRLDHDNVTSLTQIVSADVILTTKTNLPHSRSGGLEFTSNGALLPTLTFGLSGNLFYTQIDAASLGAAGLRSTVGLNGKANLDYRPTDRDVAQISLSRSDKRLTPQGYIGAITIVNLGYKRQIDSNLSAVATFSDLFNGQSLRRILNTATLQDDYRRQQLGQIAYFGLVYSFGSGKPAKAAGFDYDK